MTCPVLKNQLEVTAATELHVAGCGDCQRALQDQKALMSLLDIFEAPAVSVDFNRQLWKRIDASPEPGLLDMVRSWLRPAVPLVAAAALVVAGFVYDHRAMNPVQPHSVSVSDADKVEQALDDIQMLGQFEKSDPAV